MSGQMLSVVGLGAWTVGISLSFTQDNSTRQTSTLSQMINIIFSQLTLINAGLWIKNAFCWWCQDHIHPCKKSVLCFDLNYNLNSKRCTQCHFICVVLAHLQYDVVKIVFLLSSIDKMLKILLEYHEAKIIYLLLNIYKMFKVLTRWKQSLSMGIYCSSVPSNRGENLWFL